MSLILLNLQSNQLFKLDSDNPLIIGRGNVEGCFDKRVSRSHGRITCMLDGKIRLEALHCNPCFFTRNGVPPIQQLNKNEEETLNEGDYLGLLPNAFWFKITSDKERGVKKEKEEASNSNTEMVCDADGRTSVLKTSENISETYKKQVAMPKNYQCTFIDNKSIKLGSSPEPTSNSEVTSVNSSKINTTSSELSSKTSSVGIEKTKLLPLWMYEIDAPNESHKTPNKHSLPSNREDNRKKPKLLTEIELKKEPAEENTGIKKQEVDMNECDTTLLNIPSTSKINNTDEGPQRISKPETQLENSPIQGESSKESNKKEGYESDVNNEGDSGARPICQYERNCYRKNPQHKLEYCHPGDSDYVPYEERPLCQFGAACYRRNEVHKVQYRHPTPSSSLHNVSSESSCSHGSIASSPLPVKRRRKKVKRGNSDYEDDDEYDLEDPFINDASSDEYIPSDLDSEEDFEASREDD